MRPSRLKRAARRKPRKVRASHSRRSFGVCRNCAGHRRVVAGESARTRGRTRALRLLMSTPRYRDPADSAARIFCARTTPLHARTAARARGRSSRLCLYLISCGPGAHKRTHAGCSADSAGGCSQGGRLAGTAGRQVRGKRKAVGRRRALNSLCHSAGPHRVVRAPASKRSARECGALSS
jgi:hypothetical protein